MKRIWIFIFLMAAGISWGQFSPSPGVMGTVDTNNAGRPAPFEPPAASWAPSRDWVDLLTAVPSLSTNGFLYIPDSARSTTSSAGPYVTNGDIPKFFTDVVGFVNNMEYDGETVAVTLFDSVMRFIDDPLVDSNKIMYIPNCQNCYNFFDNSVAGIPISTPLEVFYVCRRLKAANNERYTSRGLTIEETNAEAMQGRWNFGPDSTFSGGGVPNENQITIIRVRLSANFWMKMWLNNRQLPDSIKINGSGNASGWGLGLINHAQRQDLFCYTGRWGGYFSAAEVDSFYAVALGVLPDTGVAPYYASASNGVITFDNGSDEFIGTFDTITRTGQPIDSVESRLFVQDPGSATAGNWIDDMKIAATKKGTAAQMASVLTYAGSEVAELSSNDGRYLYMQLRVRDASGVWGRWYQSEFLINNYNWAL